MRESTFKSKYITGKRLNILISKDAYKALEKQKKQINITRYIEHLLIKADENPESIAQSFDEQNKYLDQITQLINFNKKLYLDINATFSNLNQIAYRLNLANLNDPNELKALADNKEFLLDTKQNLIDTKEEVISLKELLKTFLKTMERAKKNAQSLYLKEQPIEQKGEDNAISNE